MRKMVTMIIIGILSFIAIFGLSFKVSSINVGSGINNVDWSTDGSYIAVGCEDSNAYIYNSTLVLQTTLSEANRSIEVIRFSPDTDYLAVGWYNYGATYSHESVIVYNTSDWSVYAEFHDYGIIHQNGLGWSYDSCYIACGDHQGRIQVYNVSSKTTVHWDNSTFTDDIYGVSWSPNGTYLAVAGEYDGEIVIFDTSDWSTVHTINIYYIIDLSFSPNGNYLAYGGIYVNLTVVNTATWLEVAELPTNRTDNEIYSLKWSSGSNYIAIGGYMYNYTDELTDPITDIFVFSDDWSQVYAISHKPNSSYIRGLDWYESKIVFGDKDGNLTIHDTYLSECSYDMDNDGDVDVFDAALTWLHRTGGGYEYESKYDVDNGCAGDGDIDVFDTALVWLHKD